VDGTRVALFLRLFLQVSPPQLRCLFPTHRRNSHAGFRLRITFFPSFHTPHALARFRTPGCMDILFVRTSASSLRRLPHHLFLCRVYSLRSYLHGSRPLPHLGLDRTRCQPRACAHQRCCSPAFLSRTSHTAPPPPFWFLPCVSRYTFTFCPYAHFRATLHNAFTSRSRCVCLLHSRFAAVDGAYALALRVYRTTLLSLSWDAPHLFARAPSARVYRALSTRTAGSFFPTRRHHGTPLTYARWVFQFTRFAPFTKRYAHTARSHLTLVLRLRFAAPVLDVCTRLTNNAPGCLSRLVARPTTPLSRFQTPGAVFCGFIAPFRFITARAKPSFLNAFGFVDIILVAGHASCSTLFSYRAAPRCYVLPAAFWIYDLLRRSFTTLVCVCPLLRGNATLTHQHGFHPHCAPHARFVCVAALHSTIFARTLFCLTLPRFGFATRHILYASFVVLVSPAGRHTFCVGYVSLTALVCIRGPCRTAWRRSARTRLLHACRAAHAVLFRHARTVLIFGRSRRRSPLRTCV